MADFPTDIPDEALNILTGVNSVTSQPAKITGVTAKARALLKAADSEPFTAAEKAKVASVDQVFTGPEKAKVAAIDQVFTGPEKSKLATLDLNVLQVVVPTGTINGVNAAFTLPAAPAGGVCVMINGQALTPGSDYTISGTTLTYLAGSIPIPGDNHLALFGTTTGGAGTTVAVADEGTPLTAAVTNLNFVGAGVTATAVGSVVTVTIPGGGGGGSVSIQDEGSQVSAAATTINFVGAGVTAAGPGGTVTVTIPRPAAAEITDAGAAGIQVLQSATVGDIQTLLGITGGSAGTVITEVEDFVGTGSLNLGLSSAAANGGAVALDAANTIQDATSYGVILCTTGTTTIGARSGYQQFGTARSLFFTAAMPFDYTVSFRVAPVLLGSGADAANTTLLVFGLGNAGSSEGTYGIYFRVNNSGNFVAVVRRNSVGPDETTVDTGIAATLSTYRELSIRLKAGATRAEFYSGSTLLTSIGPTGAAVTATLPPNMDCGLRASLLGSSTAIPALNYAMRLDTIRTVRAYPTQRFPN
jgi:hypothetical protein